MKFTFSLAVPLFMVSGIFTTFANGNIAEPDHYWGDTIVNMTSASAEEIGLIQPKSQREQIADFEEALAEIDREMANIRTNINNMDDSNPELKQRYVGIYQSLSTSREYLREEIDRMKREL